MTQNRVELEIKKETGESVVGVTLEGIDDNFMPVTITTTIDGTPRAPHEPKVGEQ